MKEKVKKDAKDLRSNKRIILTTGIFRNWYCCMGSIW